MYQQRALPPHGWSMYQMLLDAGVSNPLVQVAIPAMSWTPGEADPAAQSTMIIVQGIQRMLKRAGVRTGMNGMLDSATQGALAQVGGRSWASMPWFHLYYLIRQKNFSRIVPSAAAAKAVMSTLGDDASSYESYLNHSLVPSQGSTKVTFPNVKTITQAADYAAAGFHASVKAGLAATGQARSLWGFAAMSYAKAYQGAKTGYALQTVLLAISTANVAAGVAAKAPQRATAVATTPTTVKTAPPTTTTGTKTPITQGPFVTDVGPVQGASFFSGEMFGLPSAVVVGAVALGGFYFLSKDNKKKPASRRRSSARRRPASRRRRTTRRRRR